MSATRHFPIGYIKKEATPDYYTSYQPFSSPHSISFLLFSCEHRSILQDEHQ